MMCRKYEVLLILTSTLEGWWWRWWKEGIGQVCAGRIPSADISNVTREESMTHFTSGGFALCDKGSKECKQVLRLCKSALLSEDCYRKKKKRFCLAEERLFLDRERAKKKKKRKHFVEEEHSDLMSDYVACEATFLLFFFPFPPSTSQPWSNFKTHLGFSLTCLLPASDIERVNTATVRR